MLDLIHALEARLATIEYVAQQGVIPGQLDTYDLERLIGRIKELKFIIKLLAANKISGELSEFIEG